MSVCIGNINPGSVNLGFVLSLLATLDAQRDAPTGDKLVERVILRQSGPYLDIGRNKVTEAFLKETDCEWLLFVDSDITWNTEQIRKLVEAADPDHRPVVSGIYRSPFQASDTSSGGELPVVYRWGQKEIRGEPTVTLVNDNWNEEEEWPEDDLFQADSFGAGFLLIHRGLLEKMVERYGFPAPWFLCQVVKDVMMGEDHLFCLRVAHMGYSLYAHSGVQVGHRKAHNY